MSEERDRATVQRLLALLADHLEEYLEGNDVALETLGEALEQGQFTLEDLHAAIMSLRSLGGEIVGAAVVAVDHPPGKGAQRVLSQQERDSLSTEAWGFLLDLRRRGSLDPEQFEQVLDRLTASGIRPIGVDLAREVAAHVALNGPERQADDGHGDAESAH